MTDPLETAVAAAFPDRSVASIEPQNTRPDNAAGFVTFDDGDACYVKTATDGPTRLAREAAATRYAGAHTSVGTPTVLAADPTADPPYLATEPLPGIVLNDPWTDGADRSPLLRTVGEAVARVHEARFEAPGVIEGGDADGLDLAGDSWTDTLCRTVAWRADDWFPERFADLPEALIETIRTVDPTLTETTPALLHGDPSRINVHRDPVGLLDWERALVGDPAYGLVEAAFHHLAQPDVDATETPALRRALFEGYREQAGGLPPGLDRRLPLYRAISQLLVPQAFEDWAPEVDRPTDELAADVRAEFDRLLTVARRAAG